MYIKFYNDNKKLQQLLCIVIGHQNYQIYKEFYGCSCFEDIPSDLKKF